MPDSEVVYSPSADSFDIEGYIDQTPGYLRNYVEGMSTGNLTGAQIVKLVAEEIPVIPICCWPFWNIKSHWVTRPTYQLARI